MAQKVFDKDQYPLMKAYDAQRFHPKDLKPDPVLNGRVSLPDVEKFKRDFLDPNIGQVQPITIAKVDGEPVIVDGVTRWRAAKEITDAGIGPHEDGAFYLKCQYTPAKTPLERYTLTVKANIRNEPTPADDAHSIAIFLHTFGLDESYIATKIYGRFKLDGSPDLDWVRERNAINDLTAEALALLKTGKLKSKAAVALAKLTPERQRERVAAAQNGYNLTVAAIKRAAAPAPPSDTRNGIIPDAPAPRQAPKKWSKSEFCALIDRWLEYDIPPGMVTMGVENAVRTVLGQIQDEIECGQ